jgi:hypothetical protein
MVGQSHGLALLLHLEDASLLAPACATFQAIVWSSRHVTGNCRYFTQT